VLSGGEGDRFRECILGEGPLDVVGVTAALKRSGFGGFVIGDHAAKMAGDEDRWHPKARLYQAGYLVGLARAVDELT
jgi:D-mannonate dehydratase